jgi:hypothetical protein
MDDNQHNSDSFLLYRNYHPDNQHSYDDAYPSYSYSNNNNNNNNNTDVQRVAAQYCEQEVQNSN